MPDASAEFVAKMEDVLDVYQRPERNGVADVFMIFEPLAGKRETIVTATRTAVDFAQVLQYTSDVLYPHAEKNVLITDNLNTHSTASLYKAFSPEVAHRIANRVEWHYTPKHGSWLDRAEIEIGILSRQALEKPLPTMESFKKQVSTWTQERNAAGSIHFIDFLQGSKLHRFSFGRLCKFIPFHKSVSEQRKDEFMHTVTPDRGHLGIIRKPAVIGWNAGLVVIHHMIDVRFVREQAGHVLAEVPPSGGIPVNQDDFAVGVE
jgi:hypothetical protein